MIPEPVQEITDVLTPEGIDKLKKGQILMFRSKTKRNDVRITKVDKKNHRCWGQLVCTYSAEEVGDETVGEIADLIRSKA